MPSRKCVGFGELVRSGMMYRGIRAFLKQVTRCAVEWKWNRDVCTRRTFQRRASRESRDYRYSEVTRKHRDSRRLANASTWINLNDHLPFRRYDGKMCDSLRDHLPTRQRSPSRTEWEGRARNPRAKVSIGHFEVKFARRTWKEKLQQRKKLDVFL